MIIKELISYYKPYKKGLLLDLVCSVCKSLSIALIPFFIRYLTNDVVNSDCINYKFYSFIVVSIIFLFLVSSFCGKYIKYNGTMIAEKMESNLRLKLFKHFQTRDLAFFNDHKLGEIMSYITTDTYRLSILVMTLPEVSIDFLIKIVGSGIILFLINPIFAIILMAIVLIVLASAIYFVLKIKKETENARTSYTKLISDAEESLSGIRTVQAFVNEDIEIAKFKKNTVSYLNAIDKKNYFYGKMQAIVDPILRGIIPIITLLAVFLISNGMLMLSDLIVFVLYADIFISPIFNVFMLIPELNESVVGAKRIFEVLSVESKIKDSEDNIIDFPKLKNSIEFKNVSFYYKSPKKQVFNNLNLKINAGDNVALVGESGVGKTTLCNLISRFYDSTDGEILLGGIPIKSIKLKDLRNHISFVQQDTFLFSDTIMENIRYGRLNATDEEVFEAAKNAYANEFILKFENGYQTQIGERGVKLSGGQKQRLAIARAFLNNAPILIFDEATSNLDSESENFIRKSMEMLSKNKTTIVVAHRLSTLKNVNRIFVLDNQNIQEEGTHHELLESDGAYKRLYDQQFLVNI